MDHRLGHDHAGGRAARHHQPAVREIFPQLRARRAGASPRLAGARSLQPAARPLRDQRALVADPFGRSDHPARYLRRQSQGPPVDASLPSARHALSAAPARRRRRARGRRPGAVHASACRPRRLEYDAARRALGADVPEREVLVFARPTTPIGTCGRIPRWPPTRVTWLTRTACSRWCNRARPCWSTTATTSPPSCRSRLRPDIRPAMSCSGSRMRAAAPSSAATSSITHCRSTRRIGTTWRTSGRPTPRCRAGACWNPARSTMRCCFRSISARRMWCAIAQGPDGFSARFVQGMT